MTSPRRTAVVLGASAEGGTGWTIAHLLAKENFDVVAAARNLSGVSKLAALIGARALRCDATVESDVDAMTTDAVAHGAGTIDVAVLVAGEGVLGDIDTIAEAELQRATLLNYVAPVYFIRHMARRMTAGGSIVLISSIAASRPWPGFFAYGCAKAAVETLVQYAALEFAPRGIRVNAVCPGPIATPASESFLSTPVVQAALSKETPLGRPVLPSEVAEAVAWLAIRAQHVTGECVHIDGGMHLVGRRFLKSSRLAEGVSRVLMQASPTSGALETIYLSNLE